MKKIVSRVLAPVVVAGLALGLGACAASSSSPTAAASGPLTVWVMGDSGEKFQTLVKPFTAETGVEVKVVAIPWDSIDEKLTTAVASGKGPDVLQIGLSKLRAFADAGALLPLDESSLAGYPALAASNFADGVAGDATAVNGNIVSIPWVSDTRVLFYRSDILTASGITTPPATWDELRADAKILAGRGEGQYGFYVPQWAAPLPVVMTWSNGGEVITPDGNVDFNTPEFAAAVDTYTGLYADKSVPTNSDFDEIQGFITGAAPMVFSGPYLGKAVADTAPELDGKWAAAPLPAGSASSTSLFAGSNLGVWANTSNKDGSLKLLNFLAQPETQLAWYAASGELPSVKAALTDPTLNEDPNVKVYTKQLDTAKVLPLVSNWDGLVGTELLTALNGIVLQGADRDSSLKTFFEKTGSLSIH
ncbi:extracellular solute-binding protein [Subtercola frigoramans]|uniref:Multiple sugar transport system substrate-binding protein n=1 Tax=Subtercola frigoramans TaxID=120298 RepID=A0ABS2L7X0_9MICO|nr:extracellular solute-binding protein [Subtercola frigoramans]MBM7473201.1 multiple sugar transport system substrate-binding protein [Subtercola frigoramans]